MKVKKRRQKSEGRKEGQKVREVREEMTGRKLGS